MIEDISKRVSKIETEHADLTQVFRDFSKDFHLLTSGFNEVKDVLKVLSKSQTELILFRQEFHAYIEKAQIIHQHAEERIDDCEKDVIAINANIKWGALLILGIVLEQIVRAVMK